MRGVRKLWKKQPSRHQGHWGRRDRRCFRCHSTNSPVENSACGEEQVEVGPWPSCSPWRPTGEQGCTFSPWRTQSRSRWMSQGDCAPMERGAMLEQKDSALWNDPRLEPVLKNCRLWDDCTLEKSVKDFIPWDCTLSWNRGRKEQWKRRKEQWRDAIHFPHCHSVREVCEKSPGWTWA